MGVFPPKSNPKKSFKDMFLVSWEMGPKNGLKTEKLPNIGRDAKTCEQ